MKEKEVKTNKKVQEQKKAAWKAQKAAQEDIEDDEVALHRDLMGNWAVRS